MCILAIGAHPDDVEIGCAGTLRKFILLGIDVHFLIMTDGSAGSIKINNQQLIEIRKNEAITAAEILGVKSIQFFGLEDGLTGFSRKDKIELIKIIRKIKPAKIFTHAKSDLFNDHAIIHNLVMSAVAVSGGPWFSEVEIAPFEVCEIYGYEVWNPINNFHSAVDITETMQTKLLALSLHKSQTQEINYSEAVKGLAAYRGVMSGKGRFAEVFEVYKI